MRDTLRRFAIVLSLGLGAVGCADPNQPATGSVTVGASPYVRGDLGTLMYRAVDMLLAGAPQITAEAPVIVGSISDAHHVETSSALGNIVADMIRTRIVQDGHTATEYRLRNDISFKNDDGEFLLSRNRRALLLAPTATAIVTGTYAASSEKVYVSIKLISANDAHILSGADFVMPLRDILGLIPIT